MNSLAFAFLLFLQEQIKNRLYILIFFILSPIFQTLYLFLSMIDEVIVNFFYRTKWMIHQNKFTFVKHQLNKNKLRFGLYKQCWDSDSMFFYSQILKHTKEFISLRAKGVGEFIEKRHKKLSPTRILSTLGRLSLCNSVANKPQLS